MTPVRRRIEYADARPLIQDFDMILMAGRSPISRIIRLATGSTFSHVGICVWADPEKRDADGILLLMESTPPNGSVDHYTQSVRDGVQTVELSARIMKYDGDVYWRQIAGPRTPAMREQLLQVRKELSAINYERNVLEFIGAAWHTIANAENRGSVFCSEVAAYVQKRGGILIDTAPNSEFTPEDLSSEADRVIHWADGFAPMPEMQLIVTRD